MTTTSHRIPAPIIAIHVLAGIGVLFWLSQIVAAFSSSENVWAVLILGLVLGGAHVVISLATSRHSRIAIWAMVFVFLGDTLLAIFVNWQAVLLVGFTAVLFGLTRTASGNAWFREIR